MIIKLCQLPEGKKALIKAIDLEEKKKARLFHLGIIPGEEIVCKFKSMFKSPIAYQIKGTIFAIEAKDAQRIEVEL